MNKFEEWIRIYFKAFLEDVRIRKDFSYMDLENAYIAGRTFEALQSFDAGYAVGREEAYRSLGKRESM